MKIPNDVAQVGEASTAPVYVYDLDRVRSRLDQLEAIPWPRKSLFYASMANDHPAVLRAVAQRGHGVFVNSLPHLRRAFGCGFPPTRILYAATNMSAGEMAECVGSGVHLVLDSAGQLEVFCRLTGPGQEVGLRVNVGSALDGEVLVDDPSYRFGLTPQEVGPAVSLAARHGVSVVGVHSYFGTNKRTPRALLDGLDRLGRLGTQVPELRYIDVGGGFGVGGEGPSGPFDLAHYGELAARLMTRHEGVLRRRLHLYLEPGRYLTADCGYFFVKVTDRKRRPDQIFVGTNGSVSIFPRPLFHPGRASHPCTLLGERAGMPLSPLPIHVCGNSTFSRDFLLRDAPLPVPEVGDTIGFHEAGAYCRSMFTRFLGKERPREVILGETGPRVQPRGGYSPVEAGVAEPGDSTGAGGDPCAG